MVGLHDASDSPTCAGDGMGMAYLQDYGDPLICKYAGGMLRPTVGFAFVTVVAGEDSSSRWTAETGLLKRCGTEGVFIS